MKISDKIPFFPAAKPLINDIHTKWNCLFPHDRDDSKKSIKIKSKIHYFLINYLWKFYVLTLYNFVLSLWKIENWGPILVKSGYS